jgi:hypothetical protein
LLWLAALGSAVFSTAIGYVLYFRILATAGATNLLMVTFLIPVSAIVMGAEGLGEHLAPKHFRSSAPASPRSTADSCPGAEEIANPPHSHTFLASTEFRTARCQRDPSPDRRRATPSGTDSAFHAASFAPAG